MYKIVILKFRPELIEKIFDAQLFVLVYLFLPQLDSAHMRAQMQMSVNLNLRYI